MSGFVHQATTFSADIDWQRIRTSLAGTAGIEFETYLEAARVLFGMSPPPGISIGARARRRMQAIAASANSPGRRRLLLGLERLKRLPGNLVTPSWYRSRIRSLRP